MRDIFSEGGALAQHLPNYESRPGQLKMAEAVASLLKSGEGEENGERRTAKILLAEAETGIGKSLAYLVPAVASGQRLVISTATITLQDQILKKEIPLISRLLNTEVKALCVKGRQNYLCHYRWFQWRSSPRNTSLERADLEKIDTWLQITETGDRAELAWLPDRSPLWLKISAQSHQCLGSECPESVLCFINKLRRNAGSSRLLIVNHHLFFSDVALKNKGYGEILPRYEGVIFDEAHHLESVATTFFGMSFSQYQVIDLLGDIEQQAESDCTREEKNTLVNGIRGIRHRLDRFMDIFPQQRGRFHLEPLIDKTSQWREEVDSLCGGLKRLAEELSERGNEGEGWHVLEKRAVELGKTLSAIALPTEADDADGDVRWYERRERSVSLSSTPINIADHLKRSLYPAVNCCVLTSATLTAGGDFTYMRERLGLNDRVAMLRLDSPFDYARRTLLYVPESSFPDPQHPAFSEKVSARVYDILRISKGRALVLFTSFKGMDKVSEFLQEHLSYPVLVQGSSSRHALLEQFRKQTDSVLLAVASFWEGVDVPGEALSCVIIDKLPFEVPSDPIVQARVKAIADKGGNPFFDFQIPQAILSLRQGVGRLMRSATDSGLIAIMDVRLFTKGYGREFLSSLPPSPVVRSLDPVVQFFGETVNI